ncbi:unnamed protein product [Ambrosiozyma monospora]|uniref:Unnamed protein product n=1 Tax=Ambrosiozyma monospora TaxID=43982 RepID=A0ACB5UAG5_AMBMO|nr:unnamed protein product [Ambrosiozyma monospora]
MDWVVMAWQVDLNLFTTFNRTTEWIESPTTSHQTKASNGSRTMSLKRDAMGFRIWLCDIEYGGDEYASGNQSGLLTEILKMFTLLWQFEIVKFTYFITYKKQSIQKYIQWGLERLIC